MDHDSQGFFLFSFSSSYRYDLEESVGVLALALELDGQDGKQQNLSCINKQRHSISLVSLHILILGTTCSKCRMVSHAFLPEH